MKYKSLVCPHCGANTTNTRNCECCGSLLVRFVDKGIDIANTPYLSGDDVYPGLLTELKKNLELQAENPAEIVSTDLLWKARGEMNSLGILKSGSSLWFNGMPIGLGSKDGGLVLTLDFSTCMDQSFIDFNRRMDERLQKFQQLKSFVLFTSHVGNFIDDDGYTRMGREYAVDFGKDADGASALIAEILTKVYNLKPTDAYDIFTNVGTDKINQSINAWFDSHESATESTEKTDRGGCAGSVTALIAVVGSTLFSILCLFLGR